MAQGGDEGKSRNEGVAVHALAKGTVNASLSGEPVVIAQAFPVPSLLQ